MTELRQEEGDKAKLQRKRQRIPLFVIRLREGKFLIVRS
jgi:hypothetical protein